jgi:hypothetical protein
MARRLVCEAISVCMAGDETRGRQGEGAGRARGVAGSDVCLTNKGWRGESRAFGSRILSDAETENEMRAARMRAP